MILFRKSVLFLLRAHISPRSPTNFPFFDKMLQTDKRVILPHRLKIHQPRISFFPKSSKWLFDDTYGNIWRVVPDFWQTGKFTNAFCAWCIIILIFCPVEIDMWWDFNLNFEMFEFCTPGWYVKFASNFNFCLWFVGRSLWGGFFTLWVLLFLSLNKESNIGIRPKFGILLSFFN